MSNQIELVVLRRVAGHKPGQIVVVNPDDERWASHILAGNAAALEHVIEDVAKEIGLDEEDLDYEDDDLEEEDLEGDE